MKTAMMSLHLIGDDGDAIIMTYLPRHPKRVERDYFHEKWRGEGDEIGREYVHLPCTYEDFVASLGWPRQKLPAEVAVFWATVNGNACSGRRGENT